MRAKSPLIIFVLSLVCLLGCKMTERAAFRKLDKIEKEHPQLFQADTLPPVVVHDSIEYDTLEVPVYIEGETATLELVVELGKMADSIKVLEGRLAVSAKLERDPERGQDVVFVKAECRPDTVFKEVPVPTRTVIMEKKRLPCEVVGNGLPWWYMLLSAGITAVLMYFFGIRKTAVERTVKSLK